MTSPAAEVVVHMFKGTNVVHDVVTRRRSLYSDLNLLDGIPKLSGYFPLHLGHTDRLMERVYLRDGPAYSALESFVGVSHKTSTNSPLVWESRTNAMPIVTAGQAPAFADEDTMFEWVLSTNFQPAETVHLLPQHRELITAMEIDRTNATVQVTSFGNHRIRCEVKAAGPAMVVVAQSYHPNWHAFIDDVEIPLFRANHSFQAIPVPAGEHRLELRYIDYSFRSGIGLCLAGILACMLIWARTARLSPSLPSDRPAT